MSATPCHTLQALQRAVFLAGIAAVEVPDPVDIPRVPCGPPDGCLDEAGTR